MRHMKTKITKQQREEIRRKLREEILASWKAWSLYNTDEEATKWALSLTMDQTGVSLEDKYRRAGTCFLSHLSRFNFNRALGLYERLGFDAVMTSDDFIINHQKIFIKAACRMFRKLPIDGTRCFSMNNEEFLHTFRRDDGRRKNGILLSLWKNRRIREYFKEKGEIRKLFGIRSMAELYQLCEDNIVETSEGDFTVNILDRLYRSDIYSSDAANGVCDFHDYTSYRYKNMEREGRVFKMKFGKMYMHLISQSVFGRLLNEQVAIYLCEEAKMRWVSSLTERYGNYALNVDKDFFSIYSSHFLNGEFGSCMTDRNRSDFYAKSVDASAASIVNAGGEIVARCIVFNKCVGEDGKVYRLAERQYSSDGDDILKQLLVNMLIANGFIDGYKKIGAGCSETTAWMDVEGRPMECKHFTIDCNLSADSIISYQDSFKFFNPDTCKATNVCTDEYFCNLGTCSEHYEDARNYDEYHDARTHRDVVTVFVENTEMTCAIDRLEDFTLIDGCYIHNDDIFECPICGRQRNRYDAYIAIDGYEYCSRICSNRANRMTVPQDAVYDYLTDTYIGQPTSQDVVIDLSDLF